MKIDAEQIKSKTNQLQAELERTVREKQLLQEQYFEIEGHLV